jgi:hypothetical protein
VAGVADALATDVDPGWNEPLIGPGFEQEISGLAAAGLVDIAFVAADLEPGDLGQQIGAALGELGQLGDRLGLFGFGEGPPPGVVPGRTGDLGGKDTVGSALIHPAILEHTFD